MSTYTEGHLIKQLAIQLMRDDIIVLMVEAQRSQRVAAATF